MNPDEVSAYGSLAAAAIALVALVVSIYAAVVARRGVVSSQQQAETAARTYLVQASPEVEVTLIEPEHYNGKWVWKLEIRRSGGPPNVWWRVHDCPHLLTDRRRLAVESSRSGPWHAYGLDHGYSHTWYGVIESEIEDDERLLSFDDNVVIEMADAPDSAPFVELFASDDVPPDTPRWRRTKTLHWESPDL